MSIFHAFLSDLAQSHLSRRANEEPALSSERLWAAALFADISGFTALTENLARRGPVGAEILARIVNAYFDEVIRTIGRYGGDIIYFAGDALLALWPEGDGGRADAVSAAAATGLALQHQLRDHITETGDRLSLRVGVAAGEVLALHVGGRDGRWAFIAAGEAIVRMAEAKEATGVGEVAMARAACELVNCTALPIFGQSDVLRLTEIVGPAGAGRARRDGALAKDLIKAYVPQAVRGRIQAGHTDFLAELRQISVFFVNFPDWDADADDALAAIQTRMDIVQSAVFRYDGEINKIGADDKGTTLIAVFGLPDQSHEDDPSRAVRAAMDIRANLAERDIAVSIGIATGRAFCGQVGNGQRCEYTIMGEPVNLAARLMQEAAGDIYCDQMTFAATGGKIQYDTLAPIPLKGKARPAEVYRPLARQQVRKQVHKVFGREAEQAALQKHVSQIKTHDGRVVVIEGEAGIGKSLMLDFFARTCATEDVDCLLAAADAIEKNTPYYSWRSVLGSLFDLAPSASPEERRQSVLARLNFAPDLPPLAPLLNAMLAVEFPDNDLTGQMIGQVRADNTVDLVCRLLYHHLATVQRSGRNMALIVEDAHWLDSASWALLRAVADRVRPLLVVIATRPLSDPLPADYSRLLATANVHSLRLEALSQDNAMALVCERLNVDGMPPTIRDLIQTRAQGNPFFTEELAYALRDSGIIRIEGGTCRVADETAELNTLRVPDTLQGVITSRIDQLGPAQQLTLKVASVIGRVFGMRILRDIYPVESDKPDLPIHLDTLEKLDITPVETPPPDASYIFKHVITQEITYGLLLVDHRHRFHAEVAEWYERHHGAEELVQLAPLLAHHWLQAGRPAKAIDYQETAGAQALRAGAYREAVSFFRAALGLSQEVDLHAPQERRGSWQRQLGFAYYGLGQMNKASEHLQMAVSLLGAPMPRATTRIAVELVGQIALQNLHRLAPGLVRRLPKAKANIAIEAVEAYEQLSVVFYFSQQVLRVMYAANRGLNLAERAAPCGSLARIYATMCVSAGLIPFHALARTYRRLAQQTAKVVNEYFTTAWVSYISSVYSIGTGSWQDARNGYETAMPILQKLGDLRHLDEASALLGFTLYLQGEWSRSIELYGDSYKAGQKRGDTQAQMWGLCGIAQASVPRGEIDRAIACCNELLEHASEHTRSESIFGCGILAKAHCVAGDYAAALQAARETSRMIKGFPPSAAYSLEGYAYCAETFIDVFELGDGAIGEPQILLAETKRAMADLKGFARVFPIARPRYRHLRGRLAWALGKKKDAVKEWETSLDLALDLVMPCEEGRARLELARAAANDPRDTEHFKEARRLFQDLGAVHYLRRMDTIWASAVTQPED